MTYFLCILVYTYISYIMLLILLTDCYNVAVKPRGCNLFPRQNHETQFYLFAVADGSDVVVSFQFDNPSNSLVPRATFFVYLNFSY